MTHQDRPLITFALFTYNQEEYVREAIQGALSQTYSPLEIIISDDCSSDRTYDIINEETKDYSGPHTLKLNKNPKNLGIGKHVNKIMTLSTGELIVAAAGDDISLPHRTSRIYTEWSKDRSAHKSIHSNYIRIDHNGSPLNETGSTTNDNAQDLRKHLEGKFSFAGATHAWQRSLFNEFGPLLDDVITEDLTIAFRSALTGKLAYIEEPLVKYRVGGISSDYGKLDVKQIYFGKGAQRSFVNAKQRLKDLKKHTPNSKLLPLAHSILAEIQFALDLNQNNKTIKHLLTALKKGARPHQLMKYIIYSKYPTLARVFIKTKHTLKTEGGSDHGV